MYCDHIINLLSGLGRDARRPTGWSDVEEFPSTNTLRIYDDEKEKKKTRDNNRAADKTLFAAVRFQASAALHLGQW